MCGNFTCPGHVGGSDHLAANTYFVIWGCAPIDQEEQLEQDPGPLETNLSPGRIRSDLRIPVTLGTPSLVIGDIGDIGNTQPGHWDIGDIWNTQPGHWGRLVVTLSVSRGGLPTGLHPRYSGFSMLFNLLREANRL